MTESAPSAILLLHDGTVFQGKAIGSNDDGYAVGEVVFNTSMTGYQEVLTDPSYSGQFVTFSYPHIGNYGINEEDNESAAPTVSGLVVRELVDFPSNQRATMSLPQWLEKHKIIGIEGIDTRALVRHLREHGVMMGVIVHNANAGNKFKWWQFLKERVDYSSINYVEQVATEEPYTVTFSDPEVIDPAGFGPLGLAFSPLGESTGEGGAESVDADAPHVVVVDFGVKWSILRSLLQRGARVTVVPYTYPVEKIEALHPDGLLISNGPGDPRRLKEESKKIRQLAEKYPTFGICLGHQLLAQGFGGESFKLRYGHRGPNQPCLELKSRRVLITSQNHGYAVAHDTLSAVLKKTSKNLNDDTISGLRHYSLPVFSVQYHPEAGPGPNDAQVEFDLFFEMMRTKQVPAI